MFRKLREFKIWFRTKVLKQNLLLHVTVETNKKAEAVEMFKEALVPEHATVCWYYAFDSKGERIKVFRAVWYAHGDPIETRGWSFGGVKHSTYENFIK